MCLKSIFALCIVYCLHSSTLFAQSGPNITLRLRTGVGTYAMGDLKDLQQATVRAGELRNIAVVHNFPPHINHQILVGLRTENRSEIGFLYGLASTGGRATVSDYSGSYYLDQRALLHTFGTYYSRLFNLPGKLNAELYGQANYYRTLLEFEESVQLGSDQLADRFDFRSMGYVLEAGGQLGYALLPRMNLSVYAGFAAGVYRELNVKGDRETGLELPNGKFARPNWNGLRAGIEIVFLFGESISK
jgi:hypothetical protein